MCGNVQERVFINTVDTKHILIQKHKEHFALAGIINIALSSTKTGMKRGSHVLYNKKAASNHVPISSLTALSFIDIMFN